MKRFLIALIGLLLITPTTFAETEKEKAIAQLDRIIYLGDKLSQDIELLDSARIFLIRRHCETIKTSIQAKGLAHAGTMRSYQQLIVTFRYSTAFFKSIESDNNEKHLKEVLTLYQAIVTDRGFDDTPYSQIVGNTFTEIHRLLQDLKKVADLPADLTKEINDLVAPVGNLIAVAKLGDRPKTFKAADPLYRKIVTLYKAFSKIQHSNPAFNIILEIQGLNEFYGEFAQIDPESEK